MTSNLGADLIMARPGEVATTLRDQLEHRLQRAFRPEFLNRVDEVIIFRNDLVFTVQEREGGPARELAEPPHAIARPERRREEEEPPEAPGSYL